MKCLVILALCATAALSQLDETWQFGGSIDDVKLDIRLDTPSVRAGAKVKGVCEVQEQPNQAAFQFEIGRVEDGKEVILATTPDFTFVAEKPEHVENLFCRVKSEDADQWQSKEFSVQFSELSVVVKTLPRGVDTTVLICEISPKPASLAKYRFKWIAPSGRVLAHAPIANVKTATLKTEGPDGFVCEIMDLTSRAKMSKGLHVNSNLRTAQSFQRYAAKIVRTPTALSKGATITFTTIITPTPPGPVNYLWKYNEAILPGQTTSVFRIQSLQASHQGTYSCEMRFSDETGTPVQLIAKEIITHKKQTPAAPEVIRYTMDVVPKSQMRQEGELMTFHCNIEGPGITPQMIKWKYQRDTSTGYPSRTDLMELNPGWTVEYSPRSSFITKPSVVLSDTGFYICQVSGQMVFGALEVTTGVASGQSEDEFEAEEVGAETMICKPNERMCPGGRNCARICDGVRDCDDGSDERSCNCDPAIRACQANKAGQTPTKTNYNVNWECDGENDCGNNFDEEDCSPMNKVATCFPSKRYTCRGGSNRTIPIAYLCDGSMDCDMRDDEERCQNSRLSFEKAPMQYDYTVGDTITLTCKISAYPVPRVIWRYQWRCLPGQEVGASQTPYFRSLPLQRFDVSSTVTNCESRTPTITATLVIRNAQQADEGIYNCEAIGAGKERPLSDDFNVRIKPRYYN